MQVYIAEAEILSWGVLIFQNLLSHPCLSATETERKSLRIKSVFPHGVVIMTTLASLTALLLCVF